MEPEKMTPKKYQDAKWEDAPKAIKDFVTKTQLKKGFYLHGPVGTGKTHILYALYKHLQGYQRNVIVWNMTELIHELKLDFDRKEKKWVGERILDFEGILMLDDIGAERLTDWVRETLYLIINRRYERELVTIFTSNLTVPELATWVGDRTASRIVEMCEIINLEGEDRRLIKK